MCAVTKGVKESLIFTWSYCRELSLLLRKSQKHSTQMRVPLHPRHLLTSFVLWNTAVNINCLLVVKYEGLYAYGLIMNINIAYQRWFYQWSNHFTILHPNKKHIKWESHWSKLLRYHREIQYVVLKNTTTMRLSSRCV